MIAPCRKVVSDRFPLASFMVNLNRGRHYEVVCATDPNLFHPQNARYRNPNNFYTSRSQGLIESSGDTSTYLLPQNQLARFPENSNVFFALGSYGNKEGVDPKFSISPDALDQIPYIKIAGSLSNAKSARNNLPNNNQNYLAYGNPRSNNKNLNSSHLNSGGQAILRWGGDDALENYQTEMEMESEAFDYDDGFDDDLWESESQNYSGSSSSHTTAYSSSTSGYQQSANYHNQSYAQNTHSQDSYAHSYNAPPYHEGNGNYYQGEAFPQNYQHQSDQLQNYQPQNYQAQNYQQQNHAPMASTSLGGDAAYGESYYGNPSVAEQAPPRYADNHTLQSQTPIEIVPDAQPRFQPGHFDRYGSPGHYKHAMPEQSLPVGPASSPLGSQPAQTAVGESGGEQHYPEQSPNAGQAPNDGASEPAPTPPQAQPQPDQQAQTRGTAHDIHEFVRLLRIVSAGMPHADSYSTTFTDAEEGLRWGLIGFKQKSGEIGKVFAKAREREIQLQEAGSLKPEQALAHILGDSWQQVLQQTDPERTADPQVRMQPIAGANLWEEPWLAKLKAVGAAPYVQAAQNECAIKMIGEFAERVAHWLGFNTPQGMATLLDAFVEQGTGHGLTWIMNAAGPIRTQADRDRALQAIIGSTQVGQFQQSHGLEPTGVWDALSHAALTGALRALGTQSPILLQTPEQMYSSLLQAAQNDSQDSANQARAERLTSLFTHPELGLSQSYARSE